MSKSNLLNRKWNPIETCPENEQVLFMHFFEEEKTLFWIASGEIEDGELWIDFIDDTPTIPEGVGFQKPNYWLPLD